jgi:hypothetical protein
MTHEEKQLLLKDLCARLPYGVIVNTQKGDGHLNEITLSMFEHSLGVNIQATVRDYLPLEECKPYLRTMSSMTGEEKKELQKSFNIESSIIGEYGISSNNAWWYKKIKEPLGFDTISYNSFSGVIDWLNAHHFDYRGLIEKGLALEAPEGMYK